MAEAWAKNLGKGKILAFSAGTESYPEVKPLAVKVMEEVKIDMSAHYPKLLTEIPDKFDVLITMGCGVECPYIPSKHREDWGLDDPSGGPIEGFRVTRDLIREKVMNLMERVASGELHV